VIAMSILQLLLSRRSVNAFALPTVEGRASTQCTAVLTTRARESMVREKFLAAKPEKCQPHLSVVRNCWA